MASQGALEPTKIWLWGLDAEFAFEAHEGLNASDAVTLPVRWMKHARKN
jgi:hypothetical protein